MIDGKEIKNHLPYIPRGPAFREVMDEQERWMISHPGAPKEPLVEHLMRTFSDYSTPPYTGD